MEIEIPYVDIHTHNTRNSDHVIEFHSHSSGIHPWDIDSPKSDEKQIEPLNFIGEIGIDRSIQTSLNTQCEVFKRELKRAKIESLPVIIHSVKAHGEIVRIAQEQGFEQLMLIHGFIGTKEELSNYLKLNTVISFGARTFKSPKTVEALKIAPMDRLFLETDDQCEYLIEDVYREASSILNMSIDELKEKLYRNYIRYFGAINGELD